MSRRVIGKGPMQQLVQPSRQGTSPSRVALARWNQWSVFWYSGAGLSGVRPATMAHSTLMERSTMRSPLGE